MKSSKSSTSSWLRRHTHDPYVRLAQQEGFRTRAAYKLREIDERDRLIQKGQTIIDLGAAPGGWSQYARAKLTRGVGVSGTHGTHGTIIAIDKLAMAPIPDVFFMQADCSADNVFETLRTMLGGRSADLVLSDMAPNLSGVAATDAAGVEQLCDIALEFTQYFLKPGGTLLMKCFQGSAFGAIVQQVKSRFSSVAIRKPKASRDTSAEVFILGKTLKGLS